MTRLIKKAKRGRDQVLMTGDVSISFSDVHNKVVGVYLSGDYDYILELGVEDVENLINTLQNRIADLKKYKE